MKIVEKMKKFLILSIFSLFFLSCTQGQDNDDSKYTSGLLASGTEAPDFVIANGTSAVGESLSSFRGHYVVLEFWASWCPDCRREIPVMKSLYERYSARDVCFIGVSFDKDKDTWLKCINDNKMNWIHHSELKPWKETSISGQYNIKWIPTVYILDKKGVVVFATIHVEDIATELEKIITN